MRKTIEDVPPSRYGRRLAGALLSIAILAQGACGGGSSSSSDLGDGSDASAGSSTSAGTFVADEYGPSINSPEFLGIVEIVPAPLGKTRILDGSLPRA